MKKRVALFLFVLLLFIPCFAFSAQWYNQSFSCGEGFESMNVLVNFTMGAALDNYTGVNSNIEGEKIFNVKANNTINVSFPASTNALGDGYLQLRGNTALNVLTINGCTLFVPSSRDPQTVSFLLGALVVLSFALAFSARIF